MKSATAYWFGVGSAMGFVLQLFIAASLGVDDRNTGMHAYGFYGSRKICNKGTFLNVLKDIFFSEYACIAGCLAVFNWWGWL